MEHESTENARSRSADNKDQATPPSDSRNTHRDEDRERSRSPRRDTTRTKSKRKDAGFKWKEKRRDTDEDHKARGEGSSRRSDRDKDRDRDSYRRRSRSRSRTPPTQRDSHRERDETRRDKKPVEKVSMERKPKVEKKSAQPAVPQQPMIVVYVNDRLGTKKAIPCFASDSIKDFKMIVASMIGRRPHEILLRRQGERPFKDILTLQDYGVSSNSQLDLEIDTGD